MLSGLLLMPLLLDQNVCVYILYIYICVQTMDGRKLAACVSLMNFDRVSVAVPLACMRLLICVCRLLVYNGRQMMAKRDLMGCFYQ